MLEFMQEILPTSFLVWCTYSILLILALLGLIKVIFGMKIPLIDNFKITQDKIVNLSDEYHSLGEKIGYTINGIILQIKRKVRDSRTSKRIKKHHKIIKRKGKVSIMSLQTKSWQQILVSVILVLIAIASCVNYFWTIPYFDTITGGLMGLEIAFVAITGASGTFFIGEKLEKALTIGTELGVNLQEQLANAAQVKTLNGYIAENNALLDEIADKKTYYETKAKECSLIVAETEAYNELCKRETELIAQNVSLESKIKTLSGEIVADMANSTINVAKDVKDLVE